MANSSRSDYSGKIIKHIPDPKGLKQKINKLNPVLGRTGLNCLEYVDYYQMIDGKPLRRVYAFAYTSYKEDGYKLQLHIREVARYYDHKQYLSRNLQYYPMAGKRVDFYWHENTFTLWPEEKNTPSRFWNFWPCQHIQDRKDFLRENNLPYTGWNSKIDNISFDEYINTYLENPKIELLSKAGLGYWIRYLKYLDTSKKTLHEIFKIKQECVPLLSEPDFGFRQLMFCRKTGISDMKQIRLITDLDKLKKIYCIPNETINTILNAEKTFTYLLRLMKLKNFRLNDYLDYLRDLDKLGAISDPKAIYPKSFIKAHREASEKIKIAKSKKLMEGFEKAYKKHQKFIFEDNDFLIRPVKEPAELYKESDVLKHCVRTYDQNVAAGTTEIMFIRKKDHKDRPFYTLELKNKKVIQVRGKDNKDPDKAVEKFISGWAQNFRIKYTGEQSRYYY